MVYCWRKAVLRVPQRLERRWALAAHEGVLRVLQPKGVDTSVRGKVLYHCVTVR